MQNTAEDISNAASGHKANLSNPSASPPTSLPLFQSFLSFPHHKPFN